LPDGPEGEYIADRLADESLRFIDEAKDGPFYLNLWQYAVHAPYQSKEEYREHFEERKDTRGVQDNAVMGAMIKSLDECVGRILDKLEALDLMKSTIILFSSDNGGNMYDRTDREGQNLGAWAPEGRTPTSNAPLRSGKGSVYEGGVRVPTIFHWPGVTEPDSVSEEIVSSIDYYPTLLEMAGIVSAPDRKFDGISITEALRGGKLNREATYCHFPHSPPAVPIQKSSWVRAGDWKLIRFYVRDEYFPNRLELYNLRDDIGEINNLASSKPRLARRLERMLDHHLEEIGAEIPEEEDRQG
jgi:arylsulfatase A-like enzyme